MKISIETIAHKDQKYPTVGNWFFDEAGNLIIQVSQLSDWRYEMLIAVHEIVEVLLCRYQGISQERVDKFDKDFEAEREAGHLDDPESEPGDEPSAPYFREHCIATGIERILCAELGVKWKEYEAELCSLP